MSVATLPETLVPGTYAIDPSHSEVGFVVRHAGISKVRGHFDDLEGTITVGSDLSTTSVTATVTADSVTTGDSGRDNHLRSADFFEVEKYPTWTFTSTAVEADGEDFVLTGDLTIHGVTQRATFALEFNGAATDPFGNARAAFTANTEISRKEFGLTWNAALEAGGVLVSDKVKIVLEISAIKQA